MPSFCHSLSFHFATLVLALVAPSCTSDDDTPETDSALRASMCERLPTTCPAAFEELTGADCQATCVSATDSTTEFRRCNANASSCEDLAACKNTH